MAEKQLEKLPRNVAQWIIKKMRLVGETGRGIETIKDLEYGYKIHVGDYRALVDLRLTGIPSGLGISITGEESTNSNNVVQTLQKLTRLIFQSWSKIAANVVNTIAIIYLFLKHLKKQISPDYGILK